MRPQVKKKKDWPLFRFGTFKDCLNEFELKEKIYVRVFRNLLEAVILEGATSDLVATLAFLICHTESNLYVNSPKIDDAKHLVHIGMVSKDKRKISDVAKMITSNIQRYPTHIVVETRFHLDNSYLNSKHMNKLSLEKVMDNISETMANA